ncbi:neutral/alkaline ceramidase [Streptomyces thermocarboxydus]
MMGYGRFDQQAAGLHTRLRARAFVVAEQTSGRRVLLIVADSPMIFESVHRAVLRRLRQAYGDTYTEQNVLITATHTHAGPGGYSHHLLYNTTTFGFHKATFEAVADGLFEAARNAHEDLAPSELLLSHGTLTGVSANRSRTAFDRNPKEDRDHFPDGVDTLTTLLRVEREGRTVGAVNWFPVHGTSMSGDNRLISADNKGYAAYHWEREVHGVDYLADGAPEFVSAFAQTNSGDMSPNLDLVPPTTPADFEATRTSGLRQYEAAAAQADTPGTRLSGPVDSRLVYIDLSDVTVRPSSPATGRPTAPQAVRRRVDGGGQPGGRAGLPRLRRGRQPLLGRDLQLRHLHGLPELKQAQAPKDVFVPIGEMNRIYPWVQERVPVMLVRIGGLYLIGIPGEVTVCAGLRLRRTVAGIVGADLDDVLVAGYSNSYFHYVTTPEEYDAQQYEGGSTLFGRWQLPALQQTASELAVSLRDGTDLPLGPEPPDLTGKALTLQPGVVLDAPPLFRKFGDVLVPPRENYRTGERVEVVFAGAHPGNDLHRGDTYLRIERRDSGGAWRTVADDGDWSTRFHWARDGIAASKVTITWDIPQGTPSGTYRVVYHGDAKSLGGKISSIEGVSTAFQVR